MRYNIVMVILAIISLSISVNMYTDLRGYEHGLFYWGDAILPIHLSTGWLGTCSNSTTSYILYNFPDGLWMFSFCLIILAVWDLTLNIFSCLWLVAAFVIGLVLEIFQYSGVISGTFDWIDIIAYAIALMVAIILSQNIKNLKWKSE